MPSFPQFALESLLVFWLLQSYYCLTQRRLGAFFAKRWQLRLIPVLALSLPLIPSLFSPDLDEAMQSSTEVMSFSKLLEFQFPSFSISVGSLLLVVYFVGVVVSSFRLMDRYWLVHQFLQEKGNQATRAAAWQTMPTAVMSDLLLNWRFFDEAKKERWATQWLPIHPLFGWEALLVELLLVLNWWNPLAYRYREHWATLYSGWQEGRNARLGFLSGYSVGFASLTFGFALLLMGIPQVLSPTHRAGELAADIFEETIFENKSNRQYEYFVEWGGLKMPLKKFANPNGYSAEVEVALVDFQQMVNKPLKVFKDGMAVKPGVFSIIYKSNRTGTQAYINGIDPKKVLLLDRQRGVAFNDSLGIGDELVLFGDTEDIYLSKVEIRIKDPNAGYEPPFFVPQINHLEATMAYQIVARKGQRALVKIDPNHPNADRILELYGDARQYEIVRIPDFRTNRHYLTEAESLASKVAAANTTLTFLEKDAFYLPEYQAYQNKEVRMVWGQMAAAPSNLNYPLDSFLLSIEREPRLLVGADTLDLVSFQVIIAAKNGPAKCFETYRTGDMAIKSALQNVEDQTSIFFEKIVVRDAEGNRKLFPASFAFNIGNPVNDRRLPASNKNYWLSFGEKTEVMEVPRHNLPRPDSIPLKPKKQRGND